MCGINGFTWRDEALLEKMNGATRHRGPDGTGTYVDDHVSLGHNRLAIIDLSPRAAQPMTSADGRFVITFNGEIYTFRQLRAQLPDHAFRSESDTEVILAAFSRWGVDAFARLNGIFAFAIWDREAQELFLARDRAGVKPLYVYRAGTRVAFSSEIKALLEHPDLDRSIDPDALGLYLRLGYIPGETTLFKAVRRLPAGHYVRVTDSAYEATPFVASCRTSFRLTGRTAEQCLLTAVDNAVQRQLVSDRPLGVFLSGGIDSSTVLDAMARVRTNIDTYSVGFDLPAGSESEKFNADFLLARRTATHYGTRHHEYMLGTDGLPSLFEDAIYHLDEPVANGTALAQLALSRFARETVTVVLCGDGGDELFGGYPRYLVSRRMDAYQQTVPSRVRRLLSHHPLLAKLNVPPGAERYELFHFIKADVLRDIVPPCTGRTLWDLVSTVLRTGDDCSFTDALLDADRELWLRDESLLRTDKMAMASGLEARVPLLDNEVLDVALRIPSSEKVTLWDTKRVLKRAFRERLPAYLLGQPKRGWFAPGAKWLRLPAFHAYAREILSPGYTNATLNLFKWPAIERALADHVETRRYNLPLVWSLLAFQVWARRFGVTT